MVDNVILWIFVNSLLDRFCTEQPNFVFVKDHLFGTFKNNCKYCNDEVHESVNRDIEYYQMLEMKISTDKLLTTMFEEAKKVVENSIGEKWNCPECNFINTKSFEIYTYFKLPNILIIRLKRVMWVNGKGAKDPRTVN